MLVSEMVDLHDDEIPAVIAAEVRFILNPNRERTVPQLYWPAARDEAAPVNGWSTFLHSDALGPARSGWHYLERRRRQSP